MPPQSRIVIAENLPDDHCHQNLMKIFSAVGRYKYLVILLFHVQQLTKVILSYHTALLFGSVKNIRTCQPQISDSGTSSTSKSAKADGMHYSNKVYLFAVA